MKGYLMGTRLDTLLAELHTLEGQIQAEMAEHASTLRYKIENHRVTFEKAVKDAHLKLRQGMPSYLRGATPMIVLTAPFIYAVIIPFMLLDLFVSVSHAVCFPAYKIEKVKRRYYITFDRRYLSYLNWLEKFNCLYCAYGNGVVAYAREVAARTELRWCPIKHAQRVKGHHPHYHNFAEFGDAKAYREMQNQRAENREELPPKN